MRELVYNLQNIFNVKNHDSCLRQNYAALYYIPPYQRGYKWETTQVKQLMEDLYGNFEIYQNDPTKGEYFLQYITVKYVKIPYGEPQEETAVLEVIDGQQRLTTLTLLFKTFENSGVDNPEGFSVNHKLHYAIRENTERFLKEWVYTQNEQKRASVNEWSQFSKEYKEYDEQDIYYLFNASKLIKDFIDEGIQTEDKFNFYQYCLNQVKLIVNVVEPHVQSEKVFNSMNSNKVSLTDADLVKGLLLTRSARSHDKHQRKSFKEVLEVRANIGRQWDEMATWANQDNYNNYFLNGSENSMDSLLRLLKQHFLEDSTIDPSLKDEGTLFDFYLNLLNKGNHTNAHLIFHELLEVVALMQDWYHDDELYSLIGYLRNTKSHQAALPQLHLFFKKDKEVLKTELKKIRNESIKKQENEELSYESNRGKIHDILLALSVFKLNTPAKHFNFEAFRKGNWSLEHIFPQHPEHKDLPDQVSIAELDILIGKQNYSNNEQEIDIDFLKLHHRYLASKKENPIGKIKITKEEWVLIYECLPEQAKNNLHSIGNMALLRQEDNASLSNHIFGTKRKNIVKRISNGSFVPQHTYDVFAKLLGDTDLSDHLKYWTHDDIKAHQTYIEKAIEKISKQ